MRVARGDLPSAVVLPNKEFESGFLAAAESLRGYRGFPEDLEAPAQPEAIRGAKEWLNQRATPGAYSANVDQASLTDKFDLDSRGGRPRLTSVIGKRSAFWKLCEGERSGSRRRGTGVIRRGHLS